MNYFGAAALGFSGSYAPQPHNLHSSRTQQQRQQIRRVALAAAAASAGAAGVHLHRSGQITVPVLPSAAQVQQQRLLPKELAEVICGAIGEIVQVAVLYPLDTIKVRCQAGGLPVGAAVKQLAAAGGAVNVLKQLYAGVISASIASVAVGSLYYFTFCSAKRTATRLMSEAGSKNSNSSSTQQQQQHHYPHGSGIDYIHDPVYAAVCSDEATARLSSSSTSSSPAAAAAASAPQPDHSTSSCSSSSNKLQVNITAACAAALVGALVEAPLELFKHRAQAGQLTGNMLGHIFTALRSQGPAALYGSFFLPFCFKSLPFDIGELMTYSTLSDWKEHTVSQAATAAAAPVQPPDKHQRGRDRQQQQQQQQQRILPLGSITTAASNHTDNPKQQQQQQQQQQWLSNVPGHAWDLAIGAAAGAAAVLLSHPNDCIKTVMETGGGAAAAPGSGALGSAGAFAATGKQLVQQRGASGLMTGLAPRLVESVPSTMLYWLAVEGCRRVLEPYTAK